MNEEIVGNADIEENSILDLDKNILAILLQDKTTKKNIIWATDDYLDLGTEYASAKEITIELITGEHGGVIKPRSVKTREEQAVRVRNMAEVFTPTWICNKQANLTDDGWFVENKGFNVEKENAWEVNEGKVEFINKDKDAPNGWMHYLSRKCLEITCGEAPYLVSRYDTVTGDLIPLYSRIGLLDRKMRIINEKIRNFKDKNKSKKRWLMLAKRALHSTYGFEWSGDNVLLARENILASVREYYKDKFEEDLDVFNLEKFAEIIAWNIWQMDGLKCVVPNSCHDYVKKIEIKECDLFDKKESSVKLLSKSKSYYDIVENEIEKCQGCVKDNLHLHNGIHCKVKDWIDGKIHFYKDLVNDQRGIFSMSKDFKFDVVIGNPPYQVADGGSKASARPVYNHYVDAAKLLTNRYISLIIPARWYTGGKKLDDFRNSMLVDTNIKELHDFPITGDCFPYVNIRGGVCYFLWDKQYDNKKDLIKVVTHKGNDVKIIYRGMKYKDLNIFIRDYRAVTIIEKIQLYGENKFLDQYVSSRKPFGLSTDFVKSVKFKDRPDGINNPVVCYGKGLKRGYIDISCVLSHKDWINTWKIMTSRANNIGTELNDDNLNTVICEPGVVCTESYLLIGANIKNNNKNICKNIESYLHTKFARFCHSLAKSSQDATSKTYRFVPYQDFNVVWNDAKLYKKYKLTQDEISLIEESIKVME